MRRFLLTLFLLTVAAVACDDPAAGNNQTNNVNNVNNTNNVNNDAGDDADGGETDPALARLAVWPLDIWGQPLPAATSTLLLDGPGGTREFPVEPAVELPLTEVGDYTLCLESDQFHELCAGFSVDAGGLISGFDGTGLERFGLLTNLNRTTLADGAVLSSVAFGLPHRWFSSSGRPLRRGNQVDLLMDGEEAWGEVRKALEQAQEQVLMASWWWESDFELTRELPDHLYLTESERWENTVVGVLERSPAVVRVLVGEFWGTHDILDWITRDDTILAYAETPGDGFEFMGQGNPTSDQFRFEVAPFDFTARFSAHFPMQQNLFPQARWIDSEVPGHDVDFAHSPVGVAFQAASWHQKFSVMDQAVTFVGGMNVKATDWDTHAHAVYDPRRMTFESTAADRLEVQRKEAEPTQGPRKDYVLRIEGSAARDTADVFSRRWEHQLAAGAEFSENASPFPIDTAPLPEAGDSLVQITATMPAPFDEAAILESWWNAIRNAEDVIFIEDQYFRIPYLTGEIADRMAARPNLRLVVITKPLDEWTDGGCYWTYETVQDLREQFPGRFFLYQLRSFDTQVTWGWDETESRFTDIDVHSKMLIVDDRFMSVGSCNKNNRGVIYEGELNVAVYDPVWVRAQRIRIVDNLLGYSTASLSTDWVGLLATAAAQNDAVWDAWEYEGFDISLDGAPLPAGFTPTGFVYSLAFRDPVNCLVEDVSPDLF
jgi:phosphatidylserine/phosphatidylglycerophosphate/cardiolipin synthase-like enzyme